MPPLVLLVLGNEKEGFSDFRDAVETCKAAGPLKVYFATKAVEAAGQLNVRAFFYSVWCRRVIHVSFIMVRGLSKSMAKSTVPSCTRISRWREKRSTAMWSRSCSVTNTQEYHWSLGVRSGYPPTLDTINDTAVHLIHLMKIQGTQRKQAKLARTTIMLW